MATRIFSGAHGRLGKSVYAGRSFALPEITKKYITLYEIPCAAHRGKLTAASGDFRYFVVGGSCYEAVRRYESGPQELSEIGGAATLGHDFALCGDTLFIGDAEARSLLFSTPVPHFSADNSIALMARAWEQADGLFLKTVQSAGAFLYMPKGAFFSAGLTFRYIDSARTALAAEIAATKDGRAKEALKARLAELGEAETRHIENAGRIYAAQYYEYKNGELAVADSGGAWNDGGTLYACGSKSCGAGAVIPVSFLSDGTAVGLALISNGEAQKANAGEFVPFAGGYCYFQRGATEAPEGLLSVQGACSKKITNGYSADGNISAAAIVSRQWGFALEPSAFGISADGVTAYSFEGPFFRKGGGQGKTFKPWAIPSGAASDSAGRYIISHDGANAFLAHATQFRGFIAPGLLADIAPCDDTHYFAKSAVRTDDSIRITASPIPSGESGAAKHFTQNTPEGAVIVPWSARIGEPLEFGWWDFPTLNVKGSPPRLDRLGNEDGSDDFEAGTLLNVRKGLSATSDGYVYATGDSGSLNVMAWKYDGGKWYSNRKHFSASETRVAPYGQGNYAVYHFPGEDWSIFHAPTGNVRYQKLIEDNHDWDWLYALVGLGGGFAIADALFTMNALQQYLKESFGNAMLVYTIPHHHVIIGDTMFTETRELNNGGNKFWTFAGWVRIAKEIVAVFSVLQEAQGWSPVPEIWGVGKSFFRRLSVDEAGDLAEKAMTLIPSTYYPRWGEMPDGTGEGGLQQDIADILGDTPCLYPLPEYESTQEGQLGKDIIERMKAWTDKAQGENIPPVTTGQTFDNQVMQYAVLDPYVPIVDAKVTASGDGNSAWISLRHESGIWLSLQCNSAAAAKQIKEIDTPLELVSLGTRADGSIVALFGQGKCTYSIGDIDPYLAVFGFGAYWKRFALQSWYARYYPIEINTNQAQLNKLSDFLKTHKEGE